MSRDKLIAEALALLPAERILLVEQIWDSIAEVREALELSADERKELERRLGEYERNPQAGAPWVAVRDWQE